MVWMFTGLVCTGPGFSISVRLRVAPSLVTVGRSDMASTIGYSLTPTILATTITTSEILIV